MQYVALPKCSEFWRSQRKEVWQLLSSGSALCHALYQPLADHVQKYVPLLLSLRNSLDEVGTKSNPGMEVEVWGRGESGLRLREPSYAIGRALREHGPSPGRSSGGVNLPQGILGKRLSLDDTLDTQRTDIEFSTQCQGICPRATLWCH